MLRSRSSVRTGLSSRKGVAFLDDQNEGSNNAASAEDLDNADEYGGESSRQGTSSTFMRAATATSWLESSQYGSESARSRAESPRDMHGFDPEFGAEGPPPDGRSATESEPAVLHSKMADVPAQHGRPQDSGYHEVFVFDNGDRCAAHRTREEGFRRSR